MENSKLVVVNKSIGALNGGIELDVMSRRYAISANGRLT